MSPAPSPVPARSPDADPLERLSGLVVHDALAATAQAAYQWDILSDVLLWSPGAAGLLGTDEASIATARAFSRILRADTKNTRDSAILSSNAEDGGEGVEYRVTYRTNDGTGFVDRGRWFADETGRPTRAAGVIRRRDADEDDRPVPDALTGTLPRAALDAALAEALAARNAAASTPFAFMMVAVERVDVVNAVYGHEGGDRLLAEVARRLAKVVRGEDVVARFSGAKFGLVLRECEPGDLRVAAGRFEAALTAAFVDADAGPIAVTPLVACVPVEPDMRTPNDVYAAASVTLADARLEVGRTVAFHARDPERARTAHGAALVASQIVRSVDGGALHLAWQPVADARTGEIAFHEALARLTADDGTVWGADRFIATADDLRLAPHIDHAALRLLLDAMDDVPGAASFNVCSQTVLDGAWLSTLVAGLRHLDDPSRVIVEITESQAIRSVPDTLRFMDIVHDCGARVALDDFGAGYTAFRHLHEMPFDIIKIDGAFATGLGTSRRNRAFIRALVDLAKLFEARTVVERVEDDATATLLTQWGVDYLQGYAVGRPGPLPIR